MGNHEEIRNPIKDHQNGKIFYEDLKCTVEDQGEMGKWFDTKTGVKQGCNTSGFLFLIVMYWVMRRTVGHDENGIR